VTNKLRLIIANKYGNQDERIFLYGIKLRRKIKIPYTDIQLYASGAPKTSSQDPYPGTDYVVPAIQGLLAAARTEGYTVGSTGEITDIVFNTVATKEASDFRDRLRSLALASATIISFDSTSNRFSVSSLRESASETITPIPLDAVAHDNSKNFYDFQMRLPNRLECYSGASVQFERDEANDAWKHTLTITAGGINLDGSYIDPADESLEWSQLFDVLNANNQGGIQNIKTFENEWVHDAAGAEWMLFHFLAFSAPPLYRAELQCVTQNLPTGAELGALVSLALPGYPDRLTQTTWLVTGMSTNLEAGGLTSLDLLEMWSIPAPRAHNYLLTEAEEPIETESGEPINLESRSY
jgi:hypothetical protein